MYNTESVSSGLITGTQWDVMLNKMVEKGAISPSDLTNSGNWGNYGNNSIEYTGRMARAWISGNYWYQGAFGGKETSKTTVYGSNNGDFRVIRGGSTLITIIIAENMKRCYTNESNGGIKIGRKIK